MSIMKIIEKYWVFVALFAGVLAALLAIFLSAGQSVWFDEGYSILLAKRSVGDLLALTAVDAHPPLYYLLLKLWGGIFGFSEIALRSMSAVFLGGAVTVALLLVKRIFSARVALVAVPFLLFAPFALRYGYEIRMYALAAFVAVSATYALVRAWQTKQKRWWTLYALFVALGMYTLYMTIAIWMAHVVWLFVVSVRSKQRPFWRWQWWYAYLGAILLFALYIPTFLHQLIYSALPGVGEELTLTSLVNIESMFALFTPQWALSGWASIALVVATIVLSVWGVQVYRTLRKDQRGVFLLIVSLAVVPILFYAVTSLPPRTPVYIVRYMAHSALFIYLLVGLIVGLAWARKKLSRKATVRMGILSVGLVALFLGGVITLQSTGNFVFERMQQPMTRELRETVACNADTTIIADDPYTYIDSRFYFDGCAMKFFSKSNVEFKGGYAMLHDSPDRIGSADEVTTPILVHIGWVGSDPQFTPSDKYRIVTSAQFDKQKVDTYELIAE